jgi:Protein of unknown function (DUF1706).
MKTELSQDVQQEFNRLVKAVESTPPSNRTLKIIQATGGNVSVADLIAYQIGWGKCLIRWYETGIKKEIPEMPGEGFSKWNYIAIAKHFYEKYAYDSSDGQMKIFEQVVFQILEIIQREHLTGNLDRTGVWPWCTLLSGKVWPLSKWIRVNTASPYKRAAQLIKKI